MGAGATEPVWRGRRETTLETPGLVSKVFEGQFERKVFGLQEGDDFLEIVPGFARDPNDVPLNRCCHFELSGPDFGADVFRVIPRNSLLETNGLARVAQG